MFNKRWTLLSVYLVMQILMIVEIQHKKSERESGCSINVQSFSPIVVLAGSNKFLYPPTGTTKLQIKASKSVDIACPGSNVNVLGKKKENLIQATCISGNTFTINGEGEIPVSRSSINCSTPVKSCIKAHTSGSNKIMEIGFEISPSRFLRTITVSFNEIMQAPEYSNYTTGSVGQADQDISRIWVPPNDTYTLDVSLKTLYTRDTQRNTINGLLGLDPTSDKYISTDYRNQSFLSKGHLTALKDFFFGYQQKTTLYYINAAPQWQTFNGGNWQTIEFGLRNYSRHAGACLQVWTGVHGIATLPHSQTGQDIELYLYAKENKKALPVPELFWKVVYNPCKKLGVALLGVNNVYKSEVSEICENVLNKTNWIDRRDSTNIEKGYIYACKIEDFRKTVKSLPEFPVDGLLI